MTKTKEYSDATGRSLSLVLRQSRDHLERDLAIWKSRKRELERRTRCDPRDERLLELERRQLDARESRLQSAERGPR